ncbi:MAG TPA: DUF1571 domain-containing protein [Pirellulales bacterium]|jgi:hypothetical protein
MLLTAALAASVATAQQTSSQTQTSNQASTPRRQVTARRPVAPEAEPNREHPIASVLDYARREQSYLRESLRDFTCRLIKRERINDILQDFTYIDMWGREEIREGDRIVQPMSIFLLFQAPKNVAGRRVLFVEGQNEGKMLVRNGGRHFDYVVVNVDPNGETAREESLVPITQSGFNRILAQMIQILERDMQIDPSGQNTKVERIAGAKINKRPSSVVRIIHPQKQEGLEFHIANVFVDDELHVPVRVDLSLWPTHSGQKPPILAEYTYTDLKLNVGIPDNVFTPAHVRGR